MCPRCRLTTANIREDEFSCRGGLTNQIVYRAMIIGTTAYGPTDLVSLIQSWVKSGTASIFVRSTRQRFYIDRDCDAPLDTLGDPDCPLSVPTTATTTITTSTEATEPDTTAPSTTAKKPGAVSGAAAAGKTEIGAGVIGGLLLALVIIVLVFVLLVLLIVTIFKWKTSQKSVNDNR